MREKKQKRVAATLEMPGAGRPGRPGRDVRPHFGVESKNVRKSKKKNLHLPRGEKKLPSDYAAGKTARR